MYTYIEKIPHSKQVLQKSLEKPIILKLLEKIYEILHLSVKINRNVLKLLLEKHSLYLLL